MPTGNTSLRTVILPRLANTGRLMRPGLARVLIARPRSAGARYRSRCAGPGCPGGTASARRLRLHQGVRDRTALGDARMQRLNGGATEIMKELMGRSLGL
jgi:hypothetical protein